MSTTCWLEPQLGQGGTKYDIFQQILCTHGVTSKIANNEISFFASCSIVDNLLGSVVAVAAAYAAPVEVFKRVIITLMALTGI